MRVLVVDQDSNVLTAITRLLGEYFTIDAVTNKGDCQDLLRVNEYDVIVACERLEDGSGLELLGQTGRQRPDMLRIFCAEPERLKLLRGRLAPFRLFRTLPYPLEPRQLLAALSAAAGVEEEVEPETPEPQTPPPPTHVPLEVKVSGIARVQPPTEVQVTGSRTPTQAMLGKAAAPRKESKPPTPPRQPTKARAVQRTHITPPPRVARQPTPAALAIGSRLSAQARPKSFLPPLSETNIKRSAFSVGAGVVVIIGLILVAYKTFNLNDEPRLSTLAAPTPHVPPEVVKLLVDTEAALQRDDLKSARTDIAAIQQLAPDHPRLPDLETQLQKREAELSAARSGSVRSFSHRSAAPPKTAVAATRPPPVAAAPSPRPSAPTFSGKTLEDSPVVEEPRILERTSAEYPEDAERKGIEGSVDLSLAVSPQGTVRDVTIVSAQPANVFNRAAIAAVRHWKYEPKTVNGKPVEAQVQVRVTFKLSK